MAGTSANAARIWVKNGGATNWAATFTVYEVTPGCVAADALACDGWGKDSTLDIWRQHNDGGTLTKDGSFYALKTTTQAVDRTLYANFSQDGKAEMYQRYAGRTVTLGCWAKTSSANHVSLRIYDGTDTESAYHTGGGGWEWLEVTDTISATAVHFRPTFFFNLDATTAYISQPMLVFGNSIGEGNYTRPQGEIIWTEQRMYNSAGLTESSLSNVSETTLNIEEESLGMVPKGAKAVHATITVNDSDSAANGGNIRFLHKASGNTHVRVDCQGRANDKIEYWTGWIPCTSTGDLIYKINSSGGGATLDLTFVMSGVELR
jgi:hypothetical protein